MDENLMFDFFMSQIDVLNDIRDNEKTKLSIVLYKPIQSTCILRICKNRDLSSVCETLKTVKNSNVAYVYDYVYANGNTYIVEEKLSGETLESILAEEGNLSEKRTAQIIMAVCDGLDELHNKKPPLIHNDINPSNIMICDDGNIKLFDFDISRTYKKSATQNTELYATQEYASPEHFGYGQSGPKADIYSLGVTMHKMLTGKYLSGETRKCIYTGRMKKQIEKCTKIDLKSRYTTVRKLKKDLNRIFNFWKILLQGLLIALLVIAILVLGFFALKNENTTSQDNASSQSQSVVENPSSQDDKPIVDNTQSTSSDKNNVQSEQLPQTNVKKMVTKKTDGQVFSMVALNDGTLVYVEKISDEYHIKTLDGVDNVVGVPVDRDNISLAHNGYNDKTYLITVSGYKAHIYEVTEGLQVETTALYSKDSYANISSRNAFFSDGTFYCGTLDQLIDTNGWFAVSDVIGSDYLIANDEIYWPSSAELSKMDINANILEKYDWPKGYHWESWYGDFSNSKEVYFLLNVQKEIYIYSFDGSEFKEVAHLNDYMYFTYSSDYEQLTLSKDKIWLYDVKGQTIREFKIK